MKAPIPNDVGVLARAELRRQLLVGQGRWSAWRRPQELTASPIFLVGCPRSGTTLLFDLLRRHPDLSALADEGHVFWSAYNHPRRHGWRSDELGAEDATRVERRYLDTYLSGLGPGRPLDKTPKNVLRIPYLRSHYPSSQVVLVVRDGRATVASLLEGWRQRRGASYFLPERLRLRDYDSRIWRYILPPGWRSLQGTELAQVATRQYTAATDAALANRDRVDVVVRYEDLVANPVGTVDGLLRELGLSPARSVSAAAGESPRQFRGAITPPREGKWREVAEDLAPYLATIESRMGEWGYRD